MEVRTADDYHLLARWLEQARSIINTPQHEATYDPDIEWFVPELPGRIIYYQGTPIKYPTETRFGFRAKYIVWKAFIAPLQLIQHRTMLNEELALIRADDYLGEPKTFLVKRIEAHIRELQAQERRLREKGRERRD